MMTVGSRSAVALGLLFAVAGCADHETQQTPPADMTMLPPPPNFKPCGHAHNDYVHTRPLLDALDAAMCSVEADVWLTNGELLVAHSQAETVPGTTLRSLYLDPLKERASMHGGKILDDRDDFTLLIDVKSEAETTWAEISAELADYSDLLTAWNDGHETRGAVTVVVSGNAARTTIANATMRYAALDGLVGMDLSGDGVNARAPLVSGCWFAFECPNGLNLSWDGTGTIPAADAATLQADASAAHANGQHFRTWGLSGATDIPVNNVSSADTPAVWAAQIAAGVDRINVDDLTGFEQFISTH
jgi:glycerophosphoryl diester phosphodiesterase